MENTAKYTLDAEQLSEYIKYQENANYRKSMDGNYDLVDYVPDTSIRVWVNNDSIKYALHVHQSLEIIYPLKGNYIAYIGSEKYEIQPGEIFILPSGEPHHLEPVTTDGVRLFFLIDLNVLSRIHGFSYMASLLSTPALINYDNCGELYAPLAQLLLKICQDYFDQDTLQEFSIYSRLLNFLYRYGEYRMAQEEGAQPIENGNGRQKNLTNRLNAVFDYLDKHFTENLTLEKVADIAGFSKFHFSRLFKQCSGYTFYDYLCYRRIKHAETLLLNPGTPITEIALQSGFSSLSTFNRIFKKMKSCTPSEYRNLYAIGEQLNNH